MEARWLHKLLTLSMIWFVGNACKQRYEPPEIKNNPRLLVVDGFLTSWPDTSIITITRSRNLSDTVREAPEKNASVMVEGEKSGTVPLLLQATGSYANLLSLDSTEKYRLTIRTADGSRYESDFVPFKITPAIDSVTWKEDSASVYIMMNTHDPSDNTRYYRWSYTETWQYHTYFTTNFDYDPATDTVIVRGADKQIYFCWQTQNSKDIQLGTSSGLSRDVISNNVFHLVNKSSEKIYSHYSIEAKQVSLTRDQFEYWTNLKKTTEQLGTLFDAQPSQVSGNIHCISDPSETVLGEICASTVTRRRLFLARTQLSNYNYTPYYLSCYVEKDVTQVVSKTDHAKIEEYLVMPNHLFTFLYEYGGYHVAENICADCREHGGTTIKPDFWP